MSRWAVRSMGALALVMSLALAAPTAAVAGSSPTVTIAPLLLKAYHVAERAYLTQLKTINATFSLAVATAKSNYVAALSVATSAANRITARAALHLAIVNATVARATALSSLGKAPVNPNRFHH